MNTTIFWLVGGVVTAVVGYLFWRRISRSSSWTEIPTLETLEVPGEGSIFTYLVKRIRGLAAHSQMSDSVTMTVDDVMETAVDPPQEMLEALLEEAPPIAMGFGEEDGGEETGPAGESGAAPEEDLLRMDVAIPPQVEVGRAFDLAVAIRQAASSLLVEEDLTQLASGPVAVSWEDEMDTAVVRIHVTAPDCDIDVAEQSVTLKRRQDEPPVYFLLTPRVNGRISIQVKVYQQDLLLGNARIKTEAAIEVGHVEMVVTSHPLSLTPTDRRLLRQNLTDAFDLGELHDLIFLLGLDKDNFPQEKDELIIDLIQTCLRQGLLRDLQSVGREKRPLLPWKLETIPD